MKKANLILIVVLTVAGVMAQASNADCPLKNLKKHQLRGDTSTAYFPNRDAKSSGGSANYSGSGVLRGN
jgi:hypothetical protein